MVKMLIQCDLTKRISYVFPDNKKYYIISITSITLFSFAIRDTFVF